MSASRPRLRDRGFVRSVIAKLIKIVGAYNIYVIKHKIKICQSVYLAKVRFIQIINAVYLIYH